MEVVDSDICFLHKSNISMNHCLWNYLWSVLEEPCPSPALAP